MLVKKGLFVYIVFIIFLALAQSSFAWTYADSCSDADNWANCESIPGCGFSEFAGWCMGDVLACHNDLLANKIDCNNQIGCEWEQIYDSCRNNGVSCGSFVSSPTTCGFYGCTFYPQITQDICSAHSCTESGESCHTSSDCPDSGDSCVCSNWKTIIVYPDLCLGTINCNNWPSQSSCTAHSAACDYTNPDATDEISACLSDDQAGTGLTFEEIDSIESLATPCNQLSYDSCDGQRNCEWFGEIPSGNEECTGDRIDSCWQNPFYKEESLVNQDFKCWVRGGTIDPYKGFDLTSIGDSLLSVFDSLDIGCGEITDGVYCKDRFNSGYVKYDYSKPIFLEPDMDSEALGKEILKSYTDDQILNLRPAELTSECLAGQEYYLDCDETTAKLRTCVSGEWSDGECEEGYCIGANGCYFLLAKECSFASDCNWELGSFTPPTIFSSPQDLRYNFPGVITSFDEKTIEPIPYQFKVTMNVLPVDVGKTADVDFSIFLPDLNFAIDLGSYSMVLTDTVEAIYGSNDGVADFTDYEGLDFILYFGYVFTPENEGHYDAIEFTVSGSGSPIEGSNPFNNPRTPVVDIPFDNSFLPISFSGENNAFVYEFFQEWNDDGTITVIS